MKKNPPAHLNRDFPTALFKALFHSRKTMILYFSLLVIICLPISDTALAASAVKDDTPMIQSMIDQAPSGGKIVIPPGVYNINKNPDLVVYTDYGKSYSALKINKPLTIIMDKVTFKTKTKNAHGIFWIYKTSNVHLKGGSLLGDTLPADGSYTSRVGVLVQESENCTIENMILKNFSQGINLYKSDKCKITQVTTEDNRGSGIISMRSKNSTIDSNTIRNSGDGHLSLYGGGEFNTVSNNTVLENRPNKSDQQGITLEAEKHSAVMKNTVKGFYYGIDIKNDSRFCNISLNTAINNRYNIALRLGDPNSKLLPSHNIIIYKNITTNPRKGEPNAGIYISLAGSGHIVQGNTTNKGKLIYGSTVVKEDMKNKFVNFSANILK